jgi:hypothetical protein
MPSAISNTEKIEAVLATARASYTKSNPKSKETNKDSLESLPGGREFLI